MPANQLHVNAAELLREPAVERHPAVAVGQAFGRHAGAHLRLHLRHVVAAPGEQLVQAATRLRRVRVQRKMHPLDPDAVFPPEPLNTHGTEIAPGSDVVGEYFQDEGFGHLRYFFWAACLS